MFARAPGLSTLPLDEKNREKSRTLTVDSFLKEGIKSVFTQMFGSPYGA